MAPEDDYQLPADGEIVKAASPGIEHDDQSAAPIVGSPGYDCP